MNSEQIILTDHDSVSGQLVAGPVSEPTRGWDDYLAWAALGIAVILGAVLGIRHGANPMDRWAAVLAVLPVCLMLVDVFLVGWMLVKQAGLRALGLPVGGGVLHVVIWLATAYLSRFDVFYHLNMQDDVFGIYEARVGVLVLLCGLNVLALVIAVYAIGVTGQLLGDLSIPVAGEVSVAEDRRLEGDYVFDAQVLLTNLGYDVGGIDGVLGPKTETALKQFQAVTGLMPEGLVTEHTLLALRRRDAQNGQLSWFQTLMTFVMYWWCRLMDFGHSQWVLVRNR